MKIKLNKYERRYANNGQEAERVVSLNLLGVDRKADNKPFWAGGDVGVLQVKTARASVCKGLDIRAHILEDKAEYYAYVLGDLSAMYVMQPELWVKFVERFAYTTRDSIGKRGERGGSNGGGVKLKLKCESKTLLAWLERYGRDEIGMEV